MKKYLVMALCLVLVAAVSVVGTVAYLTASDSKTNVFTVGNVDIEILEYQRVVNDDGSWSASTTADKYGYYPDLMEPFVNDKPLMPAVYQDGKEKWDDRNGSENPSGAGSHQQSWGQINAPGACQIMDDSVKNVQDKFVFVKNTGNNDAFVRVWLAFEAGSFTAAEMEDVKLHTVCDGDHWSWSGFSEDMSAQINGVKYYFVTMDYLGASNSDGTLAPNAISYPGLLQVFLDPSITSDEAAAFGDSYDVLVYAQAVQAAGFTSSAQAFEKAFGTISAANNPWA